jgi:general secretion pathway protein B
MSYILDALRKAEAERQRGAVPDLNAQMPLPAAAESEFPAPRPARLAWLVAGGLLVGALAAAWWLYGRPSEPTPASPTRMAQAPAAAPVPAPSATAAPAPTAPVVAVAPLAAPPVTPPVTPPLAEAGGAAPANAVPAAGGAATRAPHAGPASGPQPASATAARREAPQPKAATRARSTTAAAGSDVGGADMAAGRPPRRTDAGAQASTAAPAPSGQPATPAPVRVPSLAELPGDLRQQVPALAIGGSVYSPQASARMIVVNGQVFQEGNALTPELTLEQIRPKSAVFTIRGQRFEVPL